MGDDTRVAPHWDRVERLCVELNRPPNGRTAGMFLSAAECLLLRLPSIRARSLGLRSIGEGTRRLTGDGPSTEAAEEATGGKSSSNDKLQILNYKLLYREQP